MLKPGFFKSLNIAIVETINKTIGEDKNQATRITAGMDKQPIANPLQELSAFVHR
ncbi:MAG: hypothetical protein NT066_05765 [Candidatus Omnitrophica bacterium]|nr:hypothetical protein [Candidatus Omnitrophota bacterium]